MPPVSRNDIGAPRKLSGILKNAADVLVLLAPDLDGISGRVVSRGVVVPVIGLEQQVLSFGKIVVELREGRERFGAHPIELVVVDVGGRNAGQRRVEVIVIIIF